MLWDEKDYFNNDKVEDWNQTFNDKKQDGQDRMLQIDGYKFFM